MVGRRKEEGRRACIRSKRRRGSWPVEERRTEKDQDQLLRNLWRLSKVPHKEQGNKEKKKRLESKET